MIKMILTSWSRIWKSLDNADEAHFLNTLCLHPTGTVVTCFLLISITRQPPSFPSDCCAPFPAYEVVSCVLAKSTWTETDSSTAQQQRLQLWPKTSQGHWLITCSIQRFQGHVLQYGPFHCTDYTGEKNHPMLLAIGPISVDLKLWHI